jgi:hypothetical protein
MLSLITAKIQLLTCMLGGGQVQCRLWLLLTLLSSSDQPLHHLLLAIMMASEPATEPPTADALLQCMEVSMPR